MLVIQEKCKCCMSCLEVCPVGAITKNSDGKAEIDKSVCIECGCCASCCQNSAITFD